MAHSQEAQDLSNLAELLEAGEAELQEIARHDPEVAEELEALHEVENELGFSF